MVMDGSSLTRWAGSEVERARAWAQSLRLKGKAESIGLKDNSMRHKGSKAQSQRLNLKGSVSKTQSQGLKGSGQKSR